MANYEGRARTNYVKVNDVEKMKAELKSIDGLRLIEQEGKYGFIFTSEDLGVYKDDDILEFSDWFSPFLEDGEFCVYTEIGYEKDRYYVGISHAFNNEGVFETVDFNQIYDIIQHKFGVAPTRAEY